MESSGAPNPRMDTPEIMTKTVNEALRDALAEAAQNPSKFESVIRDLGSMFETRDDSVWPKPVSEFKNAGYLEPGDVLLMTKLGSLFSWMVNIFDRSNFAHSAMVFQTPHHESGIDHVYLIESSFKGVDIETLTEIVTPSKIYPDIKLPPDYIVGVKRLAAEWATPQLRRIAASRMLHFMKNDDYNFTMLVALATRQTKRLYFNAARALFGQAPTVAQYMTQRVHFSPAEFICSGFVQFAYVDMVRTAIERAMIGRDIAETAWNDVLFSDHVNGETSMKQLMAVKPSELAETPKLKWKYLIHEGMVHRIESNDDVNAFFDRIRCKHRRLSKMG